MLGFLGLLIIKTTFSSLDFFVECKDLKHFSVILSLPNRYLLKILASVHVSCSVCEKGYCCMWRGILELDCDRFDEV